MSTTPEAHTAIMASGLHVTAYLLTHTVIPSSTAWHPCICKLGYRLLHVKTAFFNVGDITYGATAYQGSYASPGHALCPEAHSPLSTFTNNATRATLAKHL